MEDLVANFRTWRDLWKCYRSSKTSHSLELSTPPKKWAEYQAKFARCERIEAKRDMIEAAKEAHCHQPVSDPEFFAPISSQA
jgi:hypothetical protein